LNRSDAQKMGITVAIIPARGGTRGLPRKNLSNVGGQSLLARAVEAARQSNVCDGVFVTSDDNEILDAATAAGAETIRRPPELASDTALTADAVLHAIASIEALGFAVGTIVLLQPTSPLREARHVNEAVLLYRARSAGSVVSVTEAEHHPYKMFVAGEGDAIEPFRSVADLSAPRQCLPRALRQNGAIYVVGRDSLIANRAFFVEPAYGYAMDRDASIDIDDKRDLEMANMVANARMGRSL
jgi:CMP-N-acetylneuraminic acid synthetase